MTYKEFKDRISKISDDYNLNLKVTKDVSRFYIKVGDSVCASVSRVKQFFMSVESGALYLSVEERREILEAVYELSKTPLNERKDEKKNKNNLGTQTILTLIDCLDYSIEKLEDFYKENWGIKNDI